MADRPVGIDHLGQMFARCTGLFPCFRAAARRSARDGAGGFDSPSADGGIDELREFRPRRSSKSASFDSNIATCARISAFSDMYTTCS